MGDMKEYLEPYKTSHKERVAKTPQRLKYATDLLKQNGITFKVCNKSKGETNENYSV